jgi:hypothetical protein
MLIGYGNKANSDGGAFGAGADQGADACLQGAEGGTALASALALKPGKKHGAGGGKPAGLARAGCKSSPAATNQCGPEAMADGHGHHPGGARALLDRQEQVKLLEALKASCARGVGWRALERAQSGALDQEENRQGDLAAAGLQVSAPARLFSEGATTAPSKSGQREGEKRVPEKIWSKGSNLSGALIQARRWKFGPGMKRGRG